MRSVASHVCGAVDQLCLLCNPLLCMCVGGWINCAYYATPYNATPDLLCLLCNPLLCNPQSIVPIMLVCGAVDQLCLLCNPRRCLLCQQDGEAPSASTHAIVAQD